MTINGKTILKRLEQKEKERGAVTLYLNKTLLKEFKRHCGKQSMSMVIEELVKEFINTSGVRLDKKERK